MLYRHSNIGDIRLHRRSCRLRWIDLRSVFFRLLSGHCNTAHKRRAAWSVCVGGTCWKPYSWGSAV